MMVRNCVVEGGATNGELCEGWFLQTQSDISCLIIDIVYLPNENADAIESHLGGLNASIDIIRLIWIWY